MGIVDDCNESLSNEVLPFRCGSILMFSSNPNRECGSKCNLSEQRSAETTPIRKGWTRYVRFAIRKKSKFSTFFKVLILPNLVVAITKIIMAEIQTISQFMKALALECKPCKN